MELFADILRRCGYRDNVGTRRSIRENERWNSLPMHCGVQVLAALSNAAAAAGGAVEVAVEEGRVALVRMVPVTDA